MMRMLLLSGLGRCGACIRLAVIGTLVSWVLYAILQVLGLGQLVLLIALGLSSFLTVLMLAHIGAYAVWTAIRLRRLRPGSGPGHSPLAPISVWRIVGVTVSATVRLMLWALFFLQESCVALGKGGSTCTATATYKTVNGVKVYTPVTGQTSCRGDCEDPDICTWMGSPTDTNAMCLCLNDT